MSSRSSNKSSCSSSSSSSSSSSMFICVKSILTKSYRTTYNVEQYGNETFITKVSYLYRTIWNMRCVFKITRYMVLPC